MERMHEIIKQNNEIDVHDAASSLLRAAELFHLTDHKNSGLWIEHFTGII